MDQGFPSAVGYMSNPWLLLILAQVLTLIGTWSLQDQFLSVLAPLSGRNIKKWTPPKWKFQPARKNGAQWETPKKIKVINAIYALNACHAQNIESGVGAIAAKMAKDVEEPL